MIKVITGIRRCGKSYLLFELFKNHLIDNGVEDDQIIEISLDSVEFEDLQDKRKLNGAVVDEIPEGWVLNDTQTTPVGYHKYCNNKSHFKGDYDWCLIKDNNKNEI